MELGIAGLTNIEEIGRGGFGVVYRAWQPAFGRWVAVKVLGTHLDDTTQRRFERERLALGSLSDHPNIVTVYDSGATDAGLPYLVMEYMPGGSYRHPVNGQLPLAWPDALPVGIKIADALVAAHARHVLHCDIKPSNILISSFGEPVLADFGIARLLNEATGTTSDIVTASLAHAAPEVLNGAHPTDASDVWSLASTLVTTIDGHPPFARPDDATYHAMVARITGAEPVDLSGSKLPPPLREVIAKALAKDPASRTPSAAQLLADLRSVTAGPPSDETRSVPAARRPIAEAAAVPPTLSPSGEPPSRNRTPLIVAIVAIVALIAIALLARSPGGPGPAIGTTTTGSTEPAPIPGTAIGRNSVVQPDNASGTNLADAQGDIRAVNVAFRINSVGTADSVKVNGQPMVAASGQHLLVWTMDSQVFTLPNGTSSTPLPTVSLVVDGSGQAIELGSLGGSGPKSDSYLFAASVPDNPKSVDLTVVQAGVTQTFSLLNRKASGDRPPALYRDSAKPFVDSPANLLQVTPVSEVAPGTAKGQVTFKVPDVSLSLFKPDLSGHAATGKAFLWVTGQSSLSDVNAACCPDEFQFLPQSSVVLTLPDGTAIPAIHLKTDTNQGIFDGIWAFEVPADFSRGTLAVDASHILSSAASVVSLQGGPTTFDLTL